MKCLSSCIILLILTLNTEAQPKYTKQQLIEDLKVFKDILVNTKPVFEDAGRDSMEKKFSQAIRSFSMDSATGLEFMHYVPALKAKTGYDDHANILLGDKLFPATASFFPIPVYLIQDSLLVNTEKGPIPFGSMIESINGIKVREILKELAGNGQKDNFRKYRLNTAFPFLLFLKYGAKDTFTIAYKTDIDEVSEKKISCAAIGIDELPRAQSTSVFPLNRDVFTGKMNINTQFDEVSKLYYMQVPSFGVFSDDSMTTYQQFKNAFDSLFKEIRLKSAACLVIDIRGNGGGLMDIPGLLFSYLADSVFYEAQYLKMQPVKNIPLRYLKAIDKKHITSIIDAKKKIIPLI